MAWLPRVLFVFFLAITCAPSLGREAGAIDRDYTGVAASVTPFDTRYRRIERYLESEEPLRHQSLPESRRSDASDRLRVLRKYLRIATTFRYLSDGEGEGHTVGGQLSPPLRENISPDDCWQLPEETESRGAGDCEDKAIWLYARLLQTGFEDVRLVVGKYQIEQAVYHAWVVYYLTDKIYILDPTVNVGLWEARRYPEGFYKPLYSYSKANRWSHPVGRHEPLGGRGLH